MPNYPIALREPSGYFTVMHVSFSSLGMYSVVDADIGVTEINGVGGYFAPQLWLPVRVNVHHGVMRPTDGFDFVALNGRFSVGGEPFARAMPSLIGFTLQRQFNKNQQHQTLEFHLDATRVAALERMRNGGDLKLHIDLEIEVIQLHALNSSSQEQPLVETRWAHVQRYRLHASADILIPRTTWIERVLPRLGFGTVHLIELPALPVAAVKEMKEAFEALRQAQAFHHVGQYSEAVGKCRVALEGFFEYPAVTDAGGITRNVPTLKSSWQTRLGKATYDWLNQTLSALKAGTNKPHHLASATYSQFDSQMIQLVTTTVVAYAAQHLAPDSSA